MLRGPKIVLGIVLGSLSPITGVKVFYFDSEFNILISTVSNPFFNLMFCSVLILLPSLIPL